MWARKGRAPQSGADRFATLFAYKFGDTTGVLDMADAGEGRDTYTGEALGTFDRVTRFQRGGTKFASCALMVTGYANGKFNQMSASPFTRTCGPIPRTVPAPRPMPHTTTVGSSSPDASWTFTDPKAVTWNNGWRTPNGKFASPKGPGMAGANSEVAVWDAIAKKPGWQVIRGRVSVRDATGILRVYDGAAISPRGRAIGLEVKSGTARRTGSQLKFDNALNGRGPNGRVNGVGKHAGIGVRRAILISQ